MVPPELSCVALESSRVCSADPTLQSTPSAAYSLSYLVLIVMMMAMMMIIIITVMTVLVKVTVIVIVIVIVITVVIVIVIRPISLRKLWISEGLTQAQS